MHNNNNENNDWGKAVVLKALFFHSKYNTPFNQSRFEYNN